LDDEPRRTAPVPENRVAALYDSHGRGLYRYALMILADRQAAEDAVQQAFAKLLSHPGRIETVDSPEGYLCMAVRSECYSLLRRRRWEPARDERLLEIADPAGGRENERLALETALRALPPEQREVVFLKVYEGRTLKEVGDLLGESTNTIASRYRYALQKLRRALEPEGRS
jgi:RNA polymerase sigma-70 factor (ECF subfamily)